MLLGIATYSSRSQCRSWLHHSWPSPGGAGGGSRVHRHGRRRRGLAVRAQHGHHRRVQLSGGLPEDVHQAISVPVDLTPHLKASRQVIDDPGQAAQAVLINRQLPARFARNIEMLSSSAGISGSSRRLSPARRHRCRLVSRSRRDDWRIVTFAGFLLAAILLLLVLPFTWSGRGCGQSVCPERVSHPAVPDAADGVLDCSRG